MPKSVEERRLKAWVEAERARLTAELAELDKKYPDRHTDGGVWWQQVQLEWLDKDTRDGFSRARMKMARRREGKRTDRKSRSWSKLCAGLSIPTRKAYGSKQRPRR